MGPQRAQKRPHREELAEQEEQEEMMARPVPLLSITSSDDDEEANRDLSLEIVEKARRRQEVRDHKEGALQPSGGWAPVVIDLSSSDEAEAFSGSRNGGAVQAPPAALVVPVEGSDKKKKKKRKKKQKKEAGEGEGPVGGGSETAGVAVPRNGEESMGISGSVVTDTNEDMTDNIVLRKLLRGPRYFDPGSRQLESCYNCGGEDHIAANCTTEKRKRPCFVCGLFGHNANKCSQGQDCFICKRRGHFARDCPDKHRRTPKDNIICLRCGDFGHDMSSCGNAYPPDDLEKIQCYVCKDFGHFCCVDFIDTAPREISCYNCGGSGHSGVGCAKKLGEPSGAASPTLCYICGEEGHFARGCTKKPKYDRRPSEPSTCTPKSSKNRTPRCSKNRNDFGGSKSVPCDFRMGSSEPSTCTPKSSKNRTPRYSKNRNDFGGSKSVSRDFRMGSNSVPQGKIYKKSMHHEGRTSMTAGKSRIKGGWIVDDPGDFCHEHRELKPWNSQGDKPWKPLGTPRTPLQKSYYHYNSSGSSRHYDVY